MLEEQGASRFGSTERAAPITPITSWFPQAATRDVPAERATSWTAPLVLAAGWAVAAIMLVVVELAQPPRTEAFRGIRFSNAINSPGAREIVALYREQLSWLPRPMADGSLSPRVYVWGIVAAWASMFILQIAALVAVRRSRATNPAPWAIGPVIGSLLFLLYPPTSTDIFAYASFGWVADEGANPYVVPPDSLRGDPYAAFNDWTMVRTPYGPLWTGISRGIVHFSNHDPFATALGFKIFTALTAFGLAILTHRLALRLTNDRTKALVAFVLVCWSPILLTEAAATVHLDPVMMLPAMAGFALVTSDARYHRAGVLLVAISALMKPATLPLIALLVLARIARAEPFRTTVKRMALDSAMVIGVLAAAYLPFWNPALLRHMIANYNELYVDELLHSNPLWVWALDHVDSVVHFKATFGGSSGTATRYLSIALAATVAVGFLRRLLKLRRAAAENEQEASLSTRQLLLWSWAAVTVIIGILPVNAHAWYLIWSMVPLALLWVSDGQRPRIRPPIWLLGLQSWVVLSFLIYHTLPKR